MPFTNIRNIQLIRSKLNNFSMNFYMKFLSTLILFYNLNLSKIIIKILFDANINLRYFK